MRRLIFFVSIFVLAIGGVGKPERNESSIELWGPSDGVPFAMYGGEVTLEGSRYRVTLNEMGSGKFTERVLEMESINGKYALISAYTFGLENSPWSEFHFCTLKQIKENRKCGPPREISDLELISHAVKVVYTRDHFLKNVDEVGTWLKENWIFSNTVKGRG